MPTFVNINPHRAYVDDPDADGDLRRILSGEEVTADGAFADKLAGTNGFVKKNSDEHKSFKAALEGVEHTGDAAFPVPEDERTAERSGLHITGKDSGVPVADVSEEPGDVKDATGLDEFEGVAAVEQGEVERGNVPRGQEDDEHAEASTTEPSERIAEPEETGTAQTDGDSNSGPKRKSTRKRSTRKRSSKK